MEIVKKIYFSIILHKSVFIGFSGLCGILTSDSSGFLLDLFFYYYLIAVLKMETF